MLKLNRMTHFEHNCQSKFRVAIGGGGTDGKNRFVSSVLENLSDLSGTGASIMLNVALEVTVKKLLPHYSFSKQLASYSDVSLERNQKKGLEPWDCNCRMATQVFFDKTNSPTNLVTIFMSVFILILWDTLWLWGSIVYCKHWRTYFSMSVHFEIYRPFKTLGFFNWSWEDPALLAEITYVALRRIYCHGWFGFRRSCQFQLLWFCALSDFESMCLLLLIAVAWGTFEKDVGWRKTARQAPLQWLIKATKAHLAVCRFWSNEFWAAAFHFARDFLVEWWEESWNRTVHRFALQNFVEGNTLKVLVEMFSANLLSEILVPGLHQSVHFHDRDKQGWHLQTYACEKGSTEFVKLKMFYDDVKHIPRDNARYVAWKVHLRPANSPPATKYEVLGPFAKYYQQRDVDFSFEITTKTPLSQVRSVLIQTTVSGVIPCTHCRSAKISRQKFIGRKFKANGIDADLGLFCSIWLHHSPHLILPSSDLFCSARSKAPVVQFSKGAKFLARSV